MPQLGLHMAVGYGVKSRTRRLATGVGFFTGSFIPDFDFLLLIPLRFVNRELALSMHRSFSHSAVFLVLLLSSTMLLHLNRSNRKRDFMVGVLSGVAVHIILDIIMWFDSVNILWPLPCSIALFRHITIPDSVYNAVSACEPACYALFLLLIRKDYHALNRALTVLVIAQFSITAVLLPFAFTMEREQYELISYSLGITAGFIPAGIILIYLKRLDFWKTQTRDNGYD